MSDFISNTKTIQRAVGVDPDGVFGPATALAVLAELHRRDGAEPAGDDDIPLQPQPLDSRTEKNLLTLDPLARDMLRHFALLAKATAATLGCDYIAISGNRTWEEQDALYAQGRTKPGRKVTKAKGGQSNHNFGLALDFGVFRNGDYLDEAKPALAEQVHRACAVHAKALGLEWGGDWNTPDIPHFEVFTGLTLARKRELYAQKGSVL